MTVQTRSQTKKAAALTSLDNEFEEVFRSIHRGGEGWTGVLTVVEMECWLKVLAPQHRIIWWTTGVEEGVFEDEDIPEEDYAAVYMAL
jgi:hypothetical protein